MTQFTATRAAAFAAACAFSLLGGKALAQPDRPKPAPDVRDARYGPHERNVLDLWKAKSDRPAPLLVFIHGGGFRAGDKSNLAPALLTRCLEMADDAEEMPRSRRWGASVLNPVAMTVIFTASFIFSSKTAPKIMLASS